MQAWSCRRGVNGGDSGAGCFPGPKHSRSLLCSLPNLPECSTRPASNASFPRYCLLVLPDREKGIAKHHRGGSCWMEPLFFMASQDEPKKLRRMRVNYAMPTTDKKKAEGCVPVPFSFSVSKCKKCLEGKIHSRCSSDRVWCHFGGAVCQIRHIRTWFSLESVAG